MQFTPMYISLTRLGRGQKSRFDRVYRLITSMPTGILYFRPCICIYISHPLCVEDMRILACVRSDRERKLQEMSL